MRGAKFQPSSACHFQVLMLLFSPLFFYTRGQRERSILKFTSLFNLRKEGEDKKWQPLLLVKSKLVSKK